MTSRQDLLEAQAYARRRVLAVLVGGAPGGREPEPARTGRSLLGGLVVAVVVALVVAVVALLGCEPSYAGKWRRIGDSNP